MSYAHAPFVTLTRRYGISLLAITLSTWMAGCAAIGIVSDKAAGDRPIPARYILPKDQPIAILIENYRNPDTVALSAEIVTRQIYDDLTKHKAGSFIDPNRISELRSARGDKFGELSIPQIARLVGAKYILYGEMKSFVLEPAIGGNTIKGHTAMQVRVVNATTGLTEWPPEISGGTDIKAETSYVQLGDGIDENTVRDKLIASLCTQTSRLFYSMRPSEMESNPSGIE